MYGLGVFALEPFAKNERIALLGGHILTLDELMTLDEEAQDTAFQISDDLVCTYATAEELCVWGESLGGDYFNHSCDPNSGFRGMIEIVAMREIESGEQITFDYAMCLTSDFGNMDCLCGAANCRKQVTGDDWKMPELQKRYNSYFQPYIEVRIKCLTSMAND
ncbi:MAG: SET domain-containing protein [Acidobacteriota bacterium]|nr:SET domain-containing protein [Acidobacteriota bacterium]